MPASANPRWQFTLKRVLIVIAALNALFGAVAFAGLLGAVLIGGVCGLSLLLVGWLHGDGRYLVFGLVLSLVAGAVLLAGSTVAVGCGRSIQHCTIEVVDQLSGKPIPDAAVCLRDVNAFDWPKGEPLQVIPTNELHERGLTDESGTAKLPWEFPYSDRTGLFINEAHLYVHPEFWIQVDAPDYETKLVQLDTLTGSTYDYFKLPLPRLKIQLHRRR